MRAAETTCTVQRGIDCKHANRSVHYARSKQRQRTNFYRCDDCGRYFFGSANKDAFDKFMKENTR